MIRPYRHVAPNGVFNWVGACHYNTTGDENTAVGYQALFASNTDVWPVTLAKAASPLPRQENAIFCASASG